MLHSLVDKGNTVLVIEHNLDVIKTADWIVDMGPEGGSGGGTVVAEGTPEEVAAVAASHTGGFLRPIVGASAAKPARTRTAAARKAPAKQATKRTPAPAKAAPRKAATKATTKAAAKKPTTRKSAKR